MGKYNEYVRPHIVAFIQMSLKWTYVLTGIYSADSPPEFYFLVVKEDFAICEQDNTYL